MRLVEQNKGLIGGKRHSAKLTECSLDIACMLNVWKFIILQIYMISLRWFRSFSHFLTIYPNDKYGWLIKNRRKLKNIEDKSAFISASQKINRKKLGKLILLKLKWFTFNNARVTFNNTFNMLLMFFETIFFLNVLWNDIFPHFYVRLKTLLTNLYLLLRVKQ